MLDLVREPRFFFTEKAWAEYAGEAYTDLRHALGEDDVRVVEVQESEDMYAVVIDEEQVAVYDFALH